MPILDIQTDDFEFSRLGKVHLGIRVKNDKGEEHPKDMDYFVLGDAQDVVPHYGQKPKELLIYLPFRDRDKNLDAFYRLYRNGGCYCRGTGRGGYVDYAVDPNGSGETVVDNGRVIFPYHEATGEYQVGDMVPCSGRDKATVPLYPRCQECKAIAMFKFMIRDPKNPKGIINKHLGYYQLDTSSERNIRMLTGVLNVLQSMSMNMGTGMAAIPLILKRVPGEVSQPVESKRNPGTKVLAKMPKHFLQLDIDPLYAELGMYRLAAQAVSQKVEEIAALPSGEDEDADVVDGEALYSVDTDEVDKRLSNAVADLNAMKDELPTDWGAFHHIMEQFFDKYSPTEMLQKVRVRLGIGRTEKLNGKGPDKAFWQASIDSVIETLTGSTR